MAKKIMTIISVITLACILLTMFAGCGMSPEEEFKMFRNNTTFTQTESWYILKYKAEELLEERGFEVQDSFISGYYAADEIPVVKVYALVKEAGKQKVMALSIFSEYESALVSCITGGIEVIGIGGDKTLYVPDYLREAEYCLVDGQIILS